MAWGDWPAVRFVRVPYVYLATRQLLSFRLMTIRLLGIIHDVHNDIPNPDWDDPLVPVYMYHPSFLKWSHAKATSELLRRGYKPGKLADRLVQVKSRPLAEWLPPTDDEIAEDLAWLIQQWKQRLLPGGEKIPASYIDLLKEKYGYGPEQAACERVDWLSGRHRDSDSGWYHLQGEEASQVCDNSLGKGVRCRRYEGRK